MLTPLKLPEEFFSFQELELCKLYEARLQQDPPVHDLQGTQACVVRPAGVITKGGKLRSWSQPRLHVNYYWES